MKKDRSDSEDEQNGNDNNEENEDSMNKRLIKSGTCVKHTQNFQSDSKDVTSDSKERGTFPNQKCTKIIIIIH